MQHHGAAKTQTKWCALIGRGLLIAVLGMGWAALPCNGEPYRFSKIAAQGDEILRRQDTLQPQAITLADAIIGLQMMSGLLPVDIRFQDIKGERT